MSKLTAACLAALTALTVGPSTLGQPDTTRSATIIISPPQNTSFANVVIEGGLGFTRTGSQFSHPADLRDAHNVIDFTATEGARSLPMRLVIDRDRMRSSQLPIRIGFPPQQRCIKQDLNDVWSAKPVTIDEKLALIARSKALLDNPTCRKRDLWKAAKRFYDTTCDLAQNGRLFFDVSPYHQTIYLEHALNGKQRYEATTCTGHRQHGAITKKWTKFQGTRDASTALPIYEEMLAYSTDPAWTEAWERGQITKGTLDLGLVDIYRKDQKSAFDQRDLDEALAVNSRLIALKDAEGFKTPGYLTAAFLCKERVYFTNLRDGSSLTADACEAAG